MKKRIDWVVKDSGGKPVYTARTRSSARCEVKFYKENMFADWLGDVNFPLHIERQEWVLKDVKVVV